MRALGPPSDLQERGAGGDYAESIMSLLGSFSKNPEATQLRELVFVSALTSSRALMSGRTVYLERA